MTQQVGRMTRIFNSLVGVLARRGVSLAGSRELETIGRKSGQPRRTPVNLMVVDGATHLVAPRGQTDWVRNARKNPEVTLRLGQRATTYRAVEVHGEPAVPVLRHYLKKWAWEVGAFFPKGISAKSSDAELLAILPDHPVFRLEQV
ncbi:nitroreductase family deazaflavin-dependent oxidoreductase [Luteipulveratus flavus]|uniref:Nitroreductase family deazaflavin-dependent oxidoreductase n=1 Tax=Luteipulveratus flavus TaxID=3031728 RepID=A0ABT6C8F2_9MICO|nr:nitroreductase family deazaflavin-dependent oxidoreductase [Luteipulveratus sp. YIM 133296]MDF8264808.1 nitroreductase family deazaflavin-dependent oxidoreductase [Luteipulveratus sp. YIM 133296]